MTMTIEYAGGARVTVVDEADAIMTLEESGKITTSGDWEPAGEGRERKLVWDDQDAATDNDGSKAIAQIVRTA